MMQYKYKVISLKDSENSEEGTGYLSDLSRTVREDVLALVSSLEKNYYNKHIHVNVTTEDFTVSIISEQKV